MRILMTGGDGFVGGYFKAKLWQDGHDVFDWDIKAGNDCREIFKSDIRFDAIYHFAAIVGGRVTIEGNPMSVASDLAIDADMWQYALRTKPDYVAYFSSSAAYPISLQTADNHKLLVESDIDLDNIQSPDLTYGFAKLAGEYQAKFVQEAGVRVGVFRPFSGYGEMQDLDYPFPSYMLRASRGDNPFEVWGPGTQTRDFIHIADIYNAVREYFKQGVEGPVNLGLGRSVSFIELAEKAMAAAGYQGEIQTHPDKPVGVMHRVCDPSKMFSFYEPRISLEDGIERALRRLTSAS